MIQPEVGNDRLPEQDPAGLESCRLFIEECRACKQVCIEYRGLKFQLSWKKVEILDIIDERITFNAK